jgi:adhesin/invasin
MPSRSVVWRSFVIVAVLAATACGGKETTSPPPGPSAIALISGNNQTGTVGQALPQALVVKVMDKAGAGVGGVSVTWSVTSGGGSLSNGATVTDAQGQAQVTWTAGTVAGTSNNSASATVSGLTGSPVTFTASATAGPPAQLVAVTGNNQAGVVAQALGQQLVAAARDQYGNPTAGVTVAWTVTAGGGSVSATSTTTDAQGHAAVTWTMGTTAGSNRDTVSAAAAGLAGSPVIFAASANPAAATQLALSSGDNQSGTVAQALAQPLVVRAQDQYGNNVSGVTVTWVITSGGGSVSSPSSGTDAQGQASISWTLGATAGVQHASATVTGLTGSPVAFTATALAGPAAQIAAASGNNQTGQVDSDLASPLVVLVTDSHGNPVAGVNVTWAATAGGGSITPTN